MFKFGGGARGGAHARTGPGNGQQSPDGGVSGAETKATDRKMCTRV